MGTSRLPGPALAQGIYYVATGLWPLVHLKSFLVVTGPKTDTWLVKTFGVLVAAVGGALLVAAARREWSPSIRLLGASAAAGLAASEVLFVARGRISPVYLADAAVESVLAVRWGGGASASAQPR